MKSGGSKLLRAIAIAAGAGLIMVAGALVYVHTDHFQYMVQQKIEQAIPGRIRWHPSRLSLARGQIALADLSIEGPNNEQIAAADRLLVRWSWPDLLKGAIFIDELALERPSADLKPGADGRLNLTAAFADTTAPAAQSPETSNAFPFNVIVKRFSLHQGSLRYAAAAPSTAAAIGGIDLTMGGNLHRQTANLKMSLSSGRITSDPYSVDLDSTRLEASLDQGRVSLLNMAVAGEKVELHLSGAIDDVFRSPTLDVSARLSASLDRIGQMLNLAPELSGKARLEMAVKGDLENPQARIRLDYGGGTIFGREVRQLVLDLALDNRLVTIEDLTARAASGDIELNGQIDLRSVFAKGFLDPAPDLEAIAYQFKLTQNHVQLADLLGPAALVRAVVDSTLDLKGQGVSLSAASAAGTLALDARGLTGSAALPPIDLHLATQFDLNRGTAAVRDLTLSARDMRLAVGGQVDLATRKVRADLTLDAPDLSRTLPALGLGDVAGSIRLKTRWAGSVNRPQFDISLDGKKMRFNRTRFGDVRLNARLDRSGLLRVADLMIDNQGSLVQGRGTVKLFKTGYTLAPDLPLDLDLTLSNLEAGDFVEHDIARGHLNGSVKISGTVRSPRGRLLLQGKGMAVGEIPIGDADAALTFQEGVLSVEKLHVAHKTASAEITGTAKLLDPATLKLLADPSFRADILADRVKAETYSDALKGEFSIKARLEGGLRSARGPVKIVGHSLAFADQEVEKVTLDALLEGDRLQVDALDIFLAPDERVTAGGKVWLTGFTGVKVATDGISLKRIRALAGYSPVNGILTGEIEGGGTFKNPLFHGQLSVADFTVADKSVGKVMARLKLEEHAASVDLVASAARLDATYHLLKKDFSGRLSIETDDLTPYVMLAGLKDYGGRLAAEISARGDLDAVDKISGSGRFSDLMLSFKGQEMLQTRDALFTYKDQALVIPGWNLKLLNSGRLQVRGTAALDGPMDVQAHGSIPLQAARMLNQELEDLSGDLDLSFSAGGTTTEPRIQGTIDLRSAAWTIPYLEQELKNVSGRVALTPQRVTIESVGGKLDDGRFDLGGRIDLDHFQPSRVDLRFKADALPLSVPDTLDVALSGNLHLAGTPDSSRLSGDILILDGTYYKDVKLDLIGMISGKKRQNQPEASEMTLPFLKNLALNVRIGHRYPFEVDNNLAEMEISPDLLIMGTLNRPKVTGRANITEGTVKFRGRNFEIVSGAVDFVNPYRLEPEFNIRSEVEIRHWLVTMNISGPADDLAFELDSQPAEETGDILYLILTGRTSAELASDEGGKSQTGTQFLAGLANSTYGERIKDATGLDYLGTETVADQDSDSERTRVTLGKNLSERMTIKYGVESKDGELVQSTAAEYKLLENILLSGFQDNRGIYGGALRYRLDFR